MKKLSWKKSVVTAMVCLGVASMSTSAFAAANCPYQPVSAKTRIVYTWNWLPFDASFFHQLPFVKQPVQAPPAAKTQKPAPVPVTKPAPAPVAKPAPAPAPVANPAPVTKPKQEQAVHAFAAEVAKLVNQERAKAGLQPLRFDSNLAKMALDKAKDMSNLGYFDHTSPTYGSPFDMMKAYGISYTYAGENIAMGQRTPQEVMKGWMNSPGHRANILNPNFDTIGVGYYNGYWVQEFIRKA